MVMLYKLDGTTPVPCSIGDIDLGQNLVARTESEDGKVILSTVFLWVPHGEKNSQPLLFETAVFFDNDWVDEWRYCTWEEAVRGHLAALLKMRKNLRAGKEKWWKVEH